MKKFLTIIIVTSFLSLHSFDDAFDDTDQSTTSNNSSNTVQKKISYTNEQIRTAQDKLFTLMEDPNFDIKQHQNLVDIVNSKEPKRVALLQKTSDILKNRKKGNFLSSDITKYELALRDAKTPLDFKKMLENKNNKKIESSSYDKKRNREIEMVKRYVLKNFINEAKTGNTTIQKSFEDMKSNGNSLRLTGMDMDDDLLIEIETDLATDIESPEQRAYRARQEASRIEYERQQDQDNYEQEQHRQNMNFEEHSR